MAHVIYSINTTVNGLCHHLDSVVDEAHLEYAINLTLSAEALILGRTTFDLFMEFWPGAVERSELPVMTQALARAFNAIAKFVVTSRTAELCWNNSRLLSDLDQVASLLQKSTGRVVVFGSPGLATSMLTKGLVNEIHILAQPFIGVAGPQVFKGLAKRTNLSLLGSDSLPAGSVLLRYGVNNG
ncbi:hypothetical protein CWE09_10920 [Aliidiomarina minuta]|uniref:Bacterial bifunctional deaminase-reductase C-terminal domain-containing protein n=1 Tax=Aliidiomarina minuta TaxID=880057 RepID=A0A432W4F7_9GAMM|nr:dihydrofolate reductase family protein [Aliidiomarina minuta]RUO24375.1 hypothetical protein CWE09_10920 [Aliidiomarina minuta]